MILSSHYRAAFFLIACYTCSALSNAMSHWLGTTSLQAVQILWLDSLTGLFIVTIMILSYDHRLFKTDQLKIHGLRGSLGALGNVLWIQSLMSLPLLFTVILSTTGVFLTYLGSALFFEKQLHPIRLACCALAAYGVLLSVHAEQLSWSYTLICPGLASLCFSGSSLLTKYLVKKDSVLTTLFYLLLVMVIMTTPIAFMLWQPILINQVIGIMFLGGFYVAGQLFFTQAYQLGSLTFLSPLKFIKYPLNATADFIFFNQIVGWNKIYGFSFIGLGALGLFLSVPKDNQ
jgi:drug/metabolite transporter (DMT)-like permease